MSIKRFLRGALGIALLSPFVLLFGAMVFGPPAMLLWETVDIVRMRERAVGQVDAVDIVRGTKGTTRANITYHFQIAGRIVTSNRYAPGYMGNSGGWTGGARVANDSPVGQAITVYYSGQNPELCALEYGWFCWSADPTLVVFGLAVVAFACIRVKPGGLANAIWCPGMASIVYGACELFLGPAMIRVRDLHWHALGCCAALAGAAVYAWAQKRFRLPKNDAESGAVNVADAEHSTAYLAFELIYVATLLTVIVLGSAQGAFSFAGLAIQGPALGLVDVSQFIASALVLAGVAFTAGMYIALSCAIFSCCRKLVRRIAWHMSPKATRIQ
jgi:hypothetical protein